MALGGLTCIPLPRFCTVIQPIHCVLQIRVYIDQGSIVRWEEEVSVQGTMGQA